MEIWQLYQLNNYLIAEGGLQFFFEFNDSRIVCFSECEMVVDEAEGDGINVGYRNILLCTLQCCQNRLCPPSAASAPSYSLTYLYFPQHPPLCPICDAGAHNVVSRLLP